MDIIAYAFIIAIVIFFDGIAERERRGFYAVIAMLTGIFGSQQLYADNSLLNGTQSLNMTVFLFILLMMILFSGMTVLRLRKHFK